MAAATTPSKTAVACCILIRRVIRADNGCLALAVFRGFTGLGSGIMFRVAIGTVLSSSGGQALVGVTSTFGGRSVRRYVHRERTLLRTVADNVNARFATCADLVGVSRTETDVPSGQRSGPGILDGRCSHGISRRLTSKQYQARS